MLQSLQDELAIVRYKLANARFKDETDFYSALITEIEENIAEIIDEYNAF